MPAPTRRSSAAIRRSPSGPPTSSRATPPTPRTPPRRASSRRTARCGRFRAGEPLRPWLLTIVANEARNRRRSAGRRAALALRAAGEERPSGEAAPSPEAALLAGERRAALLGRARAAARGRPARDRLPLPARAVRGGDGGGARRPAGDREVAPVARRWSGCGRSWGTTMADLHDELTALPVDWPATPDLAGAVTARLAGSRRRPRRRARAGGRRSPTASPRSRPRSRSRWPPRPTLAPPCWSGSA